jgi:hypothetical protein
MQATEHLTKGFTMVTLTPKEYDSIPAGTYVVKFADTETGIGEYGPTLKWYFEIVKGSHAGRRVSKLTGQTPTTRNSCGRMLKQLHGKIEAVDLDTLIGKTYNAHLVHDEMSGYTNIDSLWPTDGIFDDLNAVMTPKKDMGWKIPLDDLENLSDDDFQKLIAKRTSR